MQHSILPERVPRLAEWGGRLTCFTAALGTWLAERTPNWWRPLLDGGPTLAIGREKDHWLFAHSARPWLPNLGLQFQACDAWADAQAAWLAEIKAHGSVIVAADVWGLPWHAGHQRRHAPHWLVLSADARGYFIEDPLEMMTLDGPQHGRCVDVELPACEVALRALRPVEPIFELRERSIAGRQPLASAMRYRWLECVAPVFEAYAENMLAGANACMALADYFDAHGSRPEAYAQADDLWQALRQRELTVAAAECDSTFMDATERTHWQTAVAGWRRIPPLLMHASLRAQSGDAQAAHLLSAELRRLAEFEGHRLIHANVVDAQAEVATLEAAT